MTKEELNKLKKGDEIFIRAKFVRVFDDGDVLFTHTNTNGDEEVVKTEEYTHSGNVILPSEFQPAPKFEPCRRFIKGDIVTPLARDGREVPDGAPVGEKCTVVESEKNGIVCIRYDAGSEHYIHEIPYFHLELVTPVEEREPYFVAYDDKFYHVHKKGEAPALAVYSEARHPHAKEAAEAECARLNAEYRKEQDNG